MVLSDRQRTGQTPAPGDWGQWLLSGSTASTLTHVVLRHGSGLEVRGATLALHNTTIQDQQGAASPARAGGSVGGLVFVHWAQGLPADRRALHRFVGKSIAARETCACIGLKPRRLRLERPPVGRIVPARDSKTLTVVKK